MGAATVVGAVVIMVGGYGLDPSLDFGAGAYYYADIPDFQKFIPSGFSLQGSLPFIIYFALFLLWGAIMYKVWKLIDR